MDRCLKAARLRVPAAVEDIDFRHPRGLHRAQIPDGRRPHPSRGHPARAPASNAIITTRHGTQQQQQSHSGESPSEPGPHTAESGA